MAIDSIGTVINPEILQFGNVFRKVAQPLSEYRGRLLFKLKPITDPKDTAFIFTEVLHPFKESNKEFQLLENLGSGSFGEVYKVRPIASPHETYALKTFAEPQDTFDEVSIYNMLSATGGSPYIIRMVKSYPNAIILEYADKNLQSVIYSAENIPVKKIIGDILKGLSFAHKLGIVHNDLKPQNVMFINNLAKIGDWGSAFHIDKRQERFYNPTLWYMSPEILLGAEPTFAIDIWATGCIMGALLLKECIFTGNNRIDQLFQIFDKLGTPTNETWPGVEDLPEYSQNFPKWSFTQKRLDYFLRLDPSGLLLAMLTLDPAKRITADDALKHPYF